MATVTPSVTRVSENTIVFTWANMATGDIGAAVGPNHADYADRSVQFTGTIGTSTAKLECSNDGTNWEVATDPQGNDISKTAVDLEQVTERTLHMRPTVTGGAGATITATLFCARIRGFGV